MSAADGHEQSAAWELDAGSYRDRAARVGRTADGRILRGLSLSAWQEWQAISGRDFFQQAMRSGSIVRTTAVDRAALDATHTASMPWAGALEHETLPFISYPYEWSFSMLREAALLHLELLKAAVADGFTIKDGTAYNLQFRGVQPVFIDITSFERLPPATPWVGYRQFCQTFLFPLMLQAFRNLPFHPWLRGRLEGITPQECWQALSLRDRFRKGVMTHVGLHAMMEARAAGSSQGTAQALSQAGFQPELIINSARNLQRTIERLRWTPPKSTWSHYGRGEHYSDDEHQHKAAFLRKIVHTRGWQQVWDLGGNVGHYAELAAENAELVIVVDADHAAIDQCYRRLSSGSSAVRERILPLVSSVVDLSGNVGWRGRERKAFVERGKPDLILCLALIHHVVIGHGVPLPEFIEWLAGFGASLVIEFVGRDDPKVQQMVRDRRDACADYDAAVFAAALEQHYRVHHREVLSGGTRTLVFAEPKR